jgi:NADH-quinone oxidoreductase subunit N
VNFHDLLENTVQDTLGRSLGAFRPELAICATIVVLLLVRMIVPRWRAGAYVVMLGGTAAALLAAAGQTAEGPSQFLLFGGMLVYDSFSVFLRTLLLLFALVFTGFTRVSGVPDRDDATEFYVLVLGATLGMCLMVSANHALIILLGIEMASVPSYVLAGILRHRRPSSEAALKYAVFGGATAGVMLYGLSLLVGVLGSADLPTMAARLADLLEHGPADRHMVLVLGGLMLMVGLAFKLSAVPFHFWAPDVFEGAPAEVGAFLSISSKAAALGLLLRLGMVFSIADPARQYLAGLIALLAAVTCTFGNLAAYGQTNMKRLLAYSTIAHAGYMMMPVAAAVSLGGQNTVAIVAAASLAVYLVIYLFMNFGAFAIVAFLRNALGSEVIADYAGLVRRSPGLTICMAVILFSLVGLPPLAGFSAKFGIFAALFDAARPQNGSLFYNPTMLTLLVIGGLNTVLALFYYLRVVKVMILDPQPEPDRRPAIGLFSTPGAYGTVLAGAMIVLFFCWGGLLQWGQAAAAAFAR